MRTFVQERAAEDTRNKLDGIKVEEKKRKARIEGFRKQIKDLQEKLEHPLELEDEETLRAALVRIN